MPPTAIDPPMLTLAALEWPLQFCGFITAASYILSVVTGNVSQVDRLWTFLPTIYTAYFALLPLWPTEQTFILAPFVPEELSVFAKDYSPRAVMMLSMVVVWMFRLSYNTYRRGLFNLHDEDYRWAVLRTQLPPFLFQLVNLTFIAATQNVLLLLMGIPTYIAVTQPHTDLTPTDYACAGAMVVILALEFTADNQQFAYQTFKSAYLGKATKRYEEGEQWVGARLKWTSEDAERGFVTKGLWAYSRHPNFACEQAFWWVITLVPVLAPEPPFIPHYSRIPKLFFGKLMDEAATFYPILSGVCYSILFFSSTPYTESITIKKYPKTYGAYQKRVGMFSPIGTFEKKLWLRLTSGEEKVREVEQLVYGTGKGKAKAE
ncbi:hypothetical protein AAF712_004994 [Marasmius tenuissimus]|uniref:DUF1295-domain-containing protein n=1 Tax=Marasmius tenuissimus TaxID=585030 RepID=A0ABR3A1S7_9AGAR